MFLLLRCLLVCVISSETLQQDSSINHHEIDPSDSDAVTNGNSTKLQTILTQNNNQTTELQQSKSPTKSPIEETNNNSSSEITQSNTTKPTKSPTASPSTSPVSPPSTCPTTSPTTSPTTTFPTLSPTKTIDWNVSFEKHSNVDKFDDAIMHYNVIFESFECVDIECQCKHIDLKINIDDSIEKQIHHVNCQDIFNHFGFDILPGIDFEYIFHLTPTVNLKNNDNNNNNNQITLQSKSFSIKQQQQQQQQLGSFGLLLELDEHTYNELEMNAKYLSNKITNEIIRIVQVNKTDISVKIQPTQNGQTIVISIIVKTQNKQSKNNNAQFVIEKIRNLYFQPATTLTITKIVQESKSMQVTAILYINNSDKVTAGYNYGAIFFVIIVIAVCCWLMSRYYPIKFVMAVEFCKSMIVNYMTQIIHSVSQYVTNDARQVRHNFNNTKYDVLNISEDLEMGGDVGRESNGIVFLNAIFDEQNVPSFTRERYIKVLKDNWITTIEQLKQLNKDDWARFDIPPNIQQAIKSKLKDKDRDSEINRYVIGEGTTSDQNGQSTPNYLEQELAYNLSDIPTNANVVDLLPTNDEELNLSDTFSDF